MTLELDASSQVCFQRLRDLYFPPERNVVPAHVSLFHALPAAEHFFIEEQLAAAASTEPFAVTVTGLRSMGRGVMFTLASAELQRIQARLAGEFSPWLTAQDRQPYRPHIVVQNKTTPDHARKTLAALGAGFEAFEVTAESLLLWSYLGGPWRLEKTFRFGGATS